MINNSNEKLVLFDAEDHITFLTNKVDTDYHSHNYIQITIGLDKLRLSSEEAFIPNSKLCKCSEGISRNCKSSDKNFKIYTDKNEFYIKGVILDSNTSHKLHGYNEWQLYLLINPESVFGETLRLKFLQEKEIYILEEDVDKIIQLDIHSMPRIISSEEYHKFIKGLKKVLNIPIHNSDCKIDTRIQEILSYIEVYPLDKLSVKDLSNAIFLSESRLSHLFKKEIGISLSSYILHEKLRKAFYLIFKGLSITDAAIEAGFSSSSHFTNSARDKLGMTPSAIIKNSRYLQV